jgi:hypothetical protein
MRRPAASIRRTNPSCYTRRGHKLESRRAATPLAALDTRLMRPIVLILKFLQATQIIRQHISITLRQTVVAS